ncbi:T9SS sorting signal type C domain-containing protein [Flavobacterium sp. MK4S-17]|uniref:fibronectin type III domain-containing protein n=1 Tax=Flavobacterium sp. MK4S-17 TaxID=2543737 RepID=UPI0013597416|nr:T9SS sorting signal type C domain-containing protein [Flavobacterium sp. MK4S-17]
MKQKNFFLTKKTLLFYSFTLLFAFLATSRVSAQVSIGSHNTAVVTSLNGWNGNLPNGYAMSGSADTYRGTSASTSGGVYAISNAGFGYQPSSSAGSITLTGTYRNSTGSAITKLEISYKAFEVVARSSRTPGWTVTSSAGDVAALNWSFNASSSPSSPDTKNVTLTLSGSGIANNATFTISFASDRGNGSGSSPLIGLKDISVKSVKGSPPTVVTTTATNIALNTATSGGNVSSDGGAAVTARGVVWGTSQNPTTALTTKTTNGTGTGNFTSSLTNLAQNTTYYYRAYATNSEGTSYGTQYSFTTLALPTVTTVIPATDISINSATTGGEVTSEGTSAVTAKGIVWGTSPNPTVALATKTQDGTGTGAFVSSITGLEMGATYYFRAYATNAQGTAYGSESSFTTLNVVAPTVETADFDAQNDADTTIAFFLGGVNNNGNETVTERGFVWNESNADLTVGQNYTLISNGPDDSDLAFTAIAENLTPNTRYYYRAYATNTTGGTGYGNTNSFYTLAATPGEPAVSNATTTTLTATANTNGNPEATEYLIRVLVGGNYYYVNQYSELQSQPAWLAGSMLTTPVTVTGLTPGTNYTFSMKARNVSGVETSWSATTALATATPSTPFFTLIDSDLDFGAVCTNTTSAAGFFTFSASNLPMNQQIAIYNLNGFSYSLTENGTYSSGLFIPYTGQTSITVYVKFTPTEVKDYPESIEGIPGTININSSGTSTLNIAVYGNGVNTPATVLTDAASGITVTSATLAALAEQGCTTITAYGFEYSTTQGFTNGTGTTVNATNFNGIDFSADLTGLSACTTYYYKAFTTDSAGTHYGDEISFTTGNLPAAPVAVSAANIAQEGFTANWEAVEGATGYYIDVADNTAFGSSISVSGVFDDFTATSTPSTVTWTASGINWTAYRARKHASALSGSNFTKGLLMYNTAGTAGPDYDNGYFISDIIPAGGLQNVSLDLICSISTVNEKVAVAALTAPDYNFSERIVLGSQDIQSGNVNHLSFTGNITGPYKLVVYREGLSAGGTGDYIYLGNLEFSGSTAPVISGADAGNALSYNVTGLNPGTTYYYRIRAYSDNCSTGNSNVVEVETLNYLTLEDASLAFGEVCTNGEGNGFFTFSGSGMSNASFNVSALEGFSYSLTENGEYTETLTISNYSGAETTVYVKFTPNTTGEYMGSISLDGASPYEAAELIMNASGEGIYTPAVATAGVASDITIASATLPGQSVDGNCDATTAYGIEYSTVNNFADGDGTQIQGDNINGGNYSVTVSNLLPCTTYYYKAYTVTESGTVYSSQQSFSTTSLETSTALTAADITQSGFTAQWGAVEGASGYRLDISTSPEFGIQVPGTSFTEDIELASGSSYATRSWTGTNGIEWTAYKSRTDRHMDGRSDNHITLRNESDSYIISGTIPGGISNIKFKIQQTYSGSGGEVTVTILSGAGFANETAVGTIDYNQSEIKVFDSGNITGINGDFIVRIDNNAAARPMIDDIVITSADIDEPYYLEGYEQLDVNDVTSYTVTGLDDYTTYYYRVTAYADNCNSSNSNVVSVSTKPDGVMWTGTAWTPATQADGVTPLVLDTTIEVTINGDYNSGANGSFTSKKLTLNEGYTFTVADGTTVTVEDEIINNAGAANFIVENNASLMQVNDNPNLNTDEITVIKNSTPLFRQDYTMWASPVKGQLLRQFSPKTLANRFYVYGTASNSYEGVSGLSDISTNTFETGKGYLIRMPNTNTDVEGYDEGTTAYAYQGIFTGVPHNGTIQVNLPTSGSRYSGIGNPYPSPINVQEFLNQNSGVLNPGSALYFWRKKNNASASSYAVLTADAYIYNKAVGGEDGEDMLGGAEWDDLFNVDSDPSEWVINPGQGFIVKAAENPTGPLVFNNSMRVGNVHNNQFFRSSQGTTSPLSRFWLNIEGNAGGFSQTAVVYSSTATLGIDYGRDGRVFTDGGSTFIYSKAGDEKLAVQARPEFTDTDIVPVEYKVNNAGTYTIKLHRFDGVFTNQAIYLKDNVTNTIQNLKEGSYTFATEAGTFENRFEIVYVNEALSVENPVADSNSIIIYKQDNTLKIDTGKYEMTGVTVFDISGRLLYNKQSINAAQHTVNQLAVQNQVLIVQVTTANNGTISKKIAF